MKLPHKRNGHKCVGSWRRTWSTTRRRRRRHQHRVLALCTTSTSYGVETNRTLGFDAKPNVKRPSIVSACNKLRLIKHTTDACLLFRCCCNYWRKLLCVRTSRTLFDGGDARWLRRRWRQETISRMAFCAKPNTQSLRVARPALSSNARRVCRSIPLYMR